MSHHRILRIATIGFASLVALVLLAAYIGYRGSDRIQDTAQDLVRENLVESNRGAEIEAKVVAQTQELLDRLIWVLGVCFVLAAGTAILTVWALRLAFGRMEWQAAELAHVSWHMLDGHEKMARRFSHEMHDELGQSLTGLRRLLSLAPEKEFSEKPGVKRQECIAIVDEVLQDVRKLSQALRPVILDDFGLEAGLRWLCERFTQRTRIPVEYHSNLNQRLAEHDETHLFRIAQEALTNIARHSEATEAWVSLQVQNGRNLHLEVADNGHGIIRDAMSPKSPSLGMVGMRARARQLNGELIVENRKEGGLRVCVDVPLHSAESQNAAAQQQPEDSNIVG